MLYTKFFTFCNLTDMLNIKIERNFRKNIEPFKIHPQPPPPTPTPETAYRRLFAGYHHEYVWVQLEQTHRRSGHSWWVFFQAWICTMMNRLCSSIIFCYVTEYRNIADSFTKLTRLICQLGFNIFPHYFVFQSKWEIVTDLWTIFFFFESFSWSDSKYYCKG